MQIKLSNVRIAFPTLFEARTVNGDGKPAFSATFIIEPTDAQVKVVNDVIEQVAKGKWGAKADSTLKALRAGGKVCLRDGNEKANYSGFENNLFISARSTVRPLVIDRDRTPLEPEDGLPYAGSYVNASLDVWAMDNSFGKRVCASLRGVQFAKDGEAFAGSGAATADEFEDEAEFF
jgi:hypothetical protein